jgi:hypothetical protein
VVESQVRVKPHNLNTVKDKGKEKEELEMSIMIIDLII